MNLKAWLDVIQAVHISDMDLSLERVTEVARRLNLLKPTGIVITVAGTNGKGSCVAGLEAIYRSAGYRVGAFTSPSLYRHNEYVRVDGKEATDEELCAAFSRIDEARGSLTLTPFEYTALAAFEIFQRAKLTVWILEVGLGGRFDAVNVLPADVAIVTSIGIDHVDWLGDTREKIGYEKAGIFRPMRPAICGDFDPPVTLIKVAKELGTPLVCQGQQFGFEKHVSHWTWWSQTQRLENLPLPPLALENMACTLMALELLQKKIPLKLKAIEEGLKKVSLPGRIQIVPGPITRIFDVSHNPAAAEFLANWLRENEIKGKTRAVFSMLMDKDMVGTIQVVKNLIDEWLLAGLPVKRGATGEQLAEAATQAKLLHWQVCASVEQAYKIALSASQAGDRVLIFGSFHTVAKCLSNRIRKTPPPPP